MSEVREAIRYQGRETKQERDGKGERRKKVTVRGEKEGKACEGKEVKGMKKKL